MELDAAADAATAAAAAAAADAQCGHIPLDCTVNQFTYLFFYTYHFGFTHCPGVCSIS